MTEDFNKWWDSDGLLKDNPYTQGTPAYWAWEGWQAAMKEKRKCPNCERYKESAKNWRHKAYELSGHPLPWEGGDTWVGLTEEDKIEIQLLKWWDFEDTFDFDGYTRAIEAKLKEKNA
jgi:hypothetical protein